MRKLDERLHKLRKEKKLTQEDVARALGVTQQTICNWETGTAQPTIDKAIDLAEIFGITLDTLVGSSQSESKVKSRILQNFEGSKGTLIMMPIDKQPFFPHTQVKNVEIVIVNSTSIKIRIHNKHTIEQLVFVKDILSFIKDMG